MREPKYILAVRFWVAPAREAALLGWLDGGHVAEVVAQPGFLWCRRFRLAADAQGRNGWCMLYGIESRAAFEAYEANTALREKFARERAPFEAHMRIDRFAGEVDSAQGG